MSTVKIDDIDTPSTAEYAEDQETGLEQEHIDPNQITDPFDPEQIRFGPYLFL